MKMKLQAKSYKLVMTINLFTLLLSVNSAANSEVSKEKTSITIDGEAEPASLADIPLPKFNYDIDSFDSGFNPHKELIQLLDRPNELTGMTDLDFMLEFPIDK
ncbi:hypothetical protein QEJ31_06550 [Pigmentibacter sp. JX0631]|uniref:hypothetical protein n=1 Tax=Pigmentibacter sp. JX0631 TaxID=2976982 RepID=UPI002468AC57|nr:hypothetical protein [Pigmentibacter sp. JX0631]WGL61250.1 hypothetical protein QEJ31_06550 [Pigmentibacter sp. JX0631]